MKDLTNWLLGALLGVAMLSLGVFTTTQKDLSDRVIDLSVRVAVLEGQVKTLTLQLGPPSRVDSDPPTRRGR